MTEVRFGQSEADVFRGAGALGSRHWLDVGRGASGQAHRWLARDLIEGIAGPTERSHRPTSCRHQVAANGEVAAAEMRRVHPRYCVMANVVERARGRAVCLAFGKTLTYAVPEEVLTDDGKQLTDRFGYRGSGKVREPRQATAKG